MRTCRTTAPLRLAVFVALALAPGAAASAQTNDDIFPAFEWNFSTPGARANSMGRTFIGTADDATAAITNPAGLTMLTRPQVYLEFKNTNLTVRRFAKPDSLFTKETSDFGDMTSSLTFFDVSVPIGRRLAVGFARHEFLNYSESFRLESRSIPGRGCTSPGLSACGLSFPINGTSEFTAVTYAGSVAVAVTDTLRVGVSVSSNTLDANTAAHRFEVTQPLIALDLASIDARATAPGVIVGALFRPRDQFSVGLMYARGPSFSLVENYGYNPGDCVRFCASTQTPSSNQPFVNYGSPEFVNGAAIKINVPDRLGVGVTLRPSTRLAVGVDAVRITYSRLAEDFRVIYSFSTPGPALTKDNFSIADVTEIHAGAEYLLKTGSTAAFVRAGVYTNPDHSLRYIPGANDDANIVEGATFNLGSRDTVVKGSVGLGLVFSRGIQIDVGYVFQQDFVISTGVRF